MSARPVPDPEPPAAVAAEAGSRLPRSPRALMGVAAVVLVTAGWFVGVALGWIRPVDRALLAPPLTPGSAMVQILGAIALLTWPGVACLAALLVAWWCARRRLHTFALVIALAPLISWGLAALFKRLYALDRPPGSADLGLITQGGASFPSSHAAVAGATAAMLIAGSLATRQRYGTRVGWRITAAVLVVVVVLNRWLLHAHWPSDIVGGLLLGASVTVVSLVVANLHVLPPHHRPGPGTATVAVIHNPVRLIDVKVFKRTVEHHAALAGYRPPLWLETTPDDIGPGQVRAALAAGADLVLVAGGDGTVRAVCDAMAGSGVPMALIPAGTTNLLARNLGVPTDHVAALESAFQGQVEPIDLVRLTVNGGPAAGGSAHRFGVIAGVGIDAAIMGSTSDELKRSLGTAAYVLSGPQALRHRPFDVELTVDDDEPIHSRASVVLVGNVGLMPGGIQLIPDARPNDGHLDVLLASPTDVMEWWGVLQRILSQGRHTTDAIKQYRARRVRVRLREPEEYQLDGDVMGPCTEFIAEVDPGAIQMIHPGVRRGLSPAAR